MKPFWSAVQAELAQGNPAFLTLVAESTEGSPGTAGAKMMVRTDGSQVGTMGGGIMELNLLKRAADALAASSFEPSLETLWHRKEAPGKKSGMICSGSQTNLYLVCRPDPHLPVIEALLARIDRSPAAVLVVTPDGLQLEEAATDQPVGIQLDQSADSWRYSEVFVQRKRIAIFGGGHCGKALSRTMHDLGYYVTNFDTRPEVETFVSNRWADERIALEDYADGGAKLAFPETTWVVVMTADYPSDVRSLVGVLDGPFPFIGVMGSMAKINQIKADLRKAGFAPDRLEAMRAPVGVPIHSHTPEEIAISVAADVIKDLFEQEQGRQKGTATR